MSSALTAVTRCRQLKLLLQTVASFDSCYKLLAAQPQLHFDVKIAWIFDSNSKGQLIHSSTRLWHPFQKVVSESVTDMCRLWSDLGAIKTKSTKPSQMTTYPVLTLRSEMLRTIPVIGSTFPDTVTLNTINHTSVEICMGKQEEYCCCLWI